MFNFGTAVFSREGRNSSVSEWGCFGMEGFRNGGVSEWKAVPEGNFLMLHLKMNLQNGTSELKFDKPISQCCLSFSS